jgi:dTDP-4-amino-4,6-dideoxygalactose transaminase
LSTIPKQSSPEEIIPLIDLSSDDAHVKEEILSAMTDLMGRSAYIGGKVVDSFESAFAEFCGVSHCVGVANGTDALILSLRALGIGSGDEVIVPAYTFIATAAAVALTGAKPVFADITNLSLTLNPQAVERAITSKTKAIIPVHLYGHPADMDSLCSIAQSHKIDVIEDAAQAHGSLYKDKPAGSIGKLATFSFYPAKNLGAYGDGGAVVTNDPEIAEKIRRIANHGRTVHYLHGEIGTNSRLDALQAAVLNIKLPHMRENIKLRRALAAFYNNLLSQTKGLQLPHEEAWAKSAWHLYVVRSNFRDTLIERLKENGIMAYAHYPLPLHLQDAFSSLGYSVGDFPIAERVANEVASLPFYPSMSQKQAERVAQVISEELITIK